jgi:hypothetical protein
LIAQRELSRTTLYEILGVQKPSENSTCEQADKLFNHLQEGNRQNTILADEVFIFKRENYPGSLEDLPNGVCTYVGVHNMAKTPKPFAHLCKPVANPATETLSLTSILFREGTVQLQRRHLSESIGTDYLSISLTPSKLGFTVISPGGNRLPILVDSKTLQEIGEINLSLPEHTTLSVPCFDEFSGKCYFAVSQDSESNRLLGVVEWCPQSGSSHFVEVHLPQNKPVDDDDFVVLGDAQETPNTRVNLSALCKVSIATTQKWIVISAANQQIPEPVTVWIIPKQGFTFYYSPSTLKVYVLMSFIRN